MDKRILEKFLDTVEVGEPGECWNWGGRLNNAGRGIIAYEYKTDDGKRKSVTKQAHHVSYEHFTGNELTVRYLDQMCDNKLCVNPNHLQPRTPTVRLFENTTRPDGDDGCWIYQGCVGMNGYGAIYYEGENCSAHRVAYKMSRGEDIPDGMMVLHNCSEKLCVNPDHLRLGTHQDNMKDSVELEEMARGEDNANSQLIEDEVVAIKALLKSGKYLHREIAEMFGVARPTITDINKGKTWSWLE